MRRRAVPWMMLWLATAVAGGLASPAAAAPPEVIARAGLHDDFGRIVFDWPQPVEHSATISAGRLRIAFSAPMRTALGSVRRNLSDYISRIALSADGRTVTAVLKGKVRLRSFVSGNRVVVDLLRPAGAVAAAARKPADAPADHGGTARPTPLRRKADAPAKPDRAAANARTASSPHAGPAPRLSKRDIEAVRKRRTRLARSQFNRPGALVTVDAVRRGADAKIRFNWREPAAAAVFRRGNVLWVAFDKPHRIDLSSIRITGESMFEKVEQLPIPNAAVLRLAMTVPYHVTVARSDDAWIVDLGPKARPPAQPAAIDTEYGAAEQTRVTITAPDARRVIRVNDPDVGDVIEVVPLAASGLGVAEARKFLDFEVLASAQGVAIRPAAEGVSIRAEDPGVILSRHGGLRISREADVGRKSDDGSRRLFDFAAWRIGPSEDYQAIEHKLIDRVARSGGFERNAARLGLARFYVSHALGAEALGVLRALIRESPGIVKDRRVRALRGVASYLVGHYADAASDLEHPSLKQDPEVHPWLAGIAAARGDWASAYRLFEDSDKVINAWPPKLAVPFAITAAEAALSVDDVDTAGVRLALLDAAPVSESQLDYVTYLRGHLAKKKGETRKAVSLWEAVATMGDRPSRAKAAFAKINAQLELKRIKPAEAINALESLRFAWRNDVFEFDLLHRLGRLHAENKNFRDALLTLRQAATYYSEIKGAKALTAEMAEVFRNFYSSGDADKLRPITVLGLYQEFRELTPPGAEGDALIRKLVERLVAVDLLDQAAELIEHQITSRLKGAAKAEAGARLAEIRLMHRKPQEALDALAESDGAGSDEALQGRRRRAKATAFALLGRVDDALKLIAGDERREAVRLRADILWNAKRWRAASRMLAHLTGPLSTRKIGDENALLLLRRAIALALSNDTSGLAYLRDRYSDAMKKNSHGEAFLAVVGKERVDTDDYSVLARTASELDVFLAFRRGERKADSKGPSVIN